MPAAWAKQKLPEVLYRDLLTCGSRHILQVIESLDVFVGTESSFKKEAILGALANFKRGFRMPSVHG